MSQPPKADVTLQISLCAGDVAYCEQTVPALVAAHQRDVREVVAVVDECRPQSTPLINVPRRFPRREMASRLEQLHGIVGDWLHHGLIDRVVTVQPDPAHLRTLNARYGGAPTSWSHDHLGHAYSAYFAAWNCARTRYVLHFDADIVFHQAAGFSWVLAAIAAMQAHGSALGASPRIAPPDSGGDLVRVGASGSGWEPTWPLERIPEGWRSAWFSTRCHIMDRERLATVLPLTPLAGSAAQRRACRLNRWLRPCWDLIDWRTRLPRIAHGLARAIPPFPLPPEVLLHEHAQRRGFFCLYLADPRAWFLHPDEKSAPFLRLLPRLLTIATERGECPPAQRGLSSVQFAAWDALSA